MDNIISIVKNRENELEFDMEIAGAKQQGTQARFVIEATPVHYSFSCQNPGEGAKWSVIIPPLPNLESVAYPFRLEVIIDGYYFEPFRGTVQITAEPTVSPSSAHVAHPPQPVVKMASVSNHEEEEEDVSWSAPVVSEEEDKDEYEELVDIMLKREKSHESKPKIEEPVSEEQKQKNNMVKAAIKDFMKKPLIPQKKQTKDVTESKEEYVISKEEHNALNQALRDSTKIVSKGRLKETDESKTSVLSSAIQQIKEGPELSDQAKRVRDIVNSTD